MSRFNIRVYGIWLHNGSILVNEEKIRGQYVTKLPGGGMDVGEGTIDCLKREWMEELNIPVQILQHYYTTDFYQPSAYDDSQVISIYYLVAGDADCIIANTEANERTYWLSLSELTPYTFTLPIDKVIGRMLIEGFNKIKTGG